MLYNYNMSREAERGGEARRSGTARHRPGKAGRDREARHDAVFKALADARRRRVLDLLKERPLTTGHLCDGFPGLDRCTVMQHLEVLEKADLIVVKRAGRNRWNYLNPLPIKDVHDRWVSPYAARAVSLLARLKRDLEAGAWDGTNAGRD